VSRGLPSFGPFLPIGLTPLFFSFPFPDAVLGGICAMVYADRDRMFSSPMLRSSCGLIVTGVGRNLRNSLVRLCDRTFLSDLFLDGFGFIIFACSRYLSYNPLQV